MAGPLTVVEPQVQRWSATNPLATASPLTVVEPQVECNGGGQQRRECALLQLVR